MNARVIITGGSSGLGKAMAEMLKEAGAKVVITGRDHAKLKKVAGSLGIDYLELDMTAFSTLKAGAEKLNEMLGGIDVLINNAGIGEFALLEDLHYDQFKRVFDTNVVGLTLFTQAVLPFIRKEGKGSIVNIGSTASLKGFIGGSVYAASKFAVRALSQSWQAELRKENIRVIHVNPSEVPTAFNVEDRTEKEQDPKKLSPMEIAWAVRSALEMDDRGFIPEVTVWATNPF